MSEDADVAKIKESFKAYDKNGDGVISREELSEILRSCNEWSDEEIQELFAEADQNDDGKIRYGEFLDWVMGADESDAQEVTGAAANFAEAGDVEEAPAEEEADKVEEAPAEAEEGDAPVDTQAEADAAVADALAALEALDEPEKQGEADEEETSKEVEEVVFDLTMRLMKKTCVAVMVDSMGHDKATADSIFEDLAKIITLEDFLELCDVNPESRPDMKEIMDAIEAAGGGLPKEVNEGDDAAYFAEEEASEPTAPGPGAIAAAADALVRYLDREGYSEASPEVLQEMVPNILNGPTCPLSTLEKTALDSLGEDVVAKITEFKVSPPMLPASEGRISARFRCKAQVKKIIEECKAEGKKWSDPDFDVQNSPNTVLWVDQEKPGYDNTVNPPGGWKRISEMCDAPCLVKDGVTANDIRQGSAGTCFLLGAMGAIVGADKRALKKIFITHDFDVGIFGIQFCVEGEWMYLLLDDWMPVMDDGLIYCSSKDTSEWWAPLLEKAYCKLMGCFEMCDGGQSAEAVFSFCGGVNGFLSVEKKHKEDPSTYFKLLKGARQRGFLLTCGFAGSKKATGGRGPCGEPLLPCGLVSGHAYSVLKVAEAEGNQLVCIRNPWGSGEWTGKWGDNNKEGEWTDEMKAATGHVAGVDGTFWMSIADFCANSTGAEFARPFGPMWKKLTQYGRFQEGAMTATAIEDYAATADDEISLEKGAEYVVERVAGYWTECKTEAGTKMCPSKKLKLSDRPVAKFALSGDQTDNKAVVMLVQPNAYMKRKFNKHKESGLNYKDTEYPSLTLIVLDGDKVLLNKTGPYRCVWGEIALQGTDKELSVYAFSAGGTADRFSIRTYIKGGAAKMKEIPGAQNSEVQPFL